MGGWSVANDRGRGPPTARGPNAAAADRRGPPGELEPSVAIHRTERAAAPPDAIAAAPGVRTGRRSAVDERTAPVAAIPEDEGPSPDHGSASRGGDSTVDVGDARRELPVEETPVGYGGAAVAGGVLVARRLGATPALTPDVASAAARTSSDVVASLARAAVESVRHRAPGGGWLFGGALYSRRDGSDPLVHDKRRAAYRLIQRTPGVDPSSLAEELDIPLSTARHHLRVLEREGLVKDRKITGKRRFVALGIEASERLAALNDEPTARVLHVLARHGPASVSALATHLDRDPSTVTHHLKRLESASLVDRRRDGRTVTNELTMTARSLLWTWRTGDAPADPADPADPAEPSD